MLWVPQKGILRCQRNDGDVGTATIGTQVVTSGTASVKGTAVELISSTSFDVYWITIMASIFGSNTADSAGCLDILAGAATEEIIIPDLLMGGCGGVNTQDRGPKWWNFPLYIPAGTRIAAQAAGQRTSSNVRVAVWLHGGCGVPPWRVGGKVTTYGASAPSGTDVTSGASGAEGGWTQIEAATDRDHFAIIPSLQIDTADTSWLARAYQMDVAVGASTAEEMIGHPFWYFVDSVETMGGPCPQLPIYQDIPTGTRLSVRVSGSGTVDPFQAALHCMS